VNRVKETVMETFVIVKMVHTSLKSAPSAWHAMKNAASVPLLPMLALSVLLDGTTVLQNPK